MSYSEFSFHCYQLIDAFTLGILTEQQFDHAIAFMMANYPEHCLEAQYDFSLIDSFAQLDFHIIED